MCICVFICVCMYVCVWVSSMYIRVCVCTGTDQQVHISEAVCIAMYALVYHVYKGYLPLCMVCVRTYVLYNCMYCILMP